MISKDTLIKEYNAFNGTLIGLSKLLGEKYEPIKERNLGNRIRRYKRDGSIPLKSGNAVDTGETLKGSSTLYDAEGNIKLQWVKTDTRDEKTLEAYESIVESLVASIEPLDPIPETVCVDKDDRLCMYISADLHFGLMTKKETSGEDYNNEIATNRLKKAYDNLINATPFTKMGIVTDLGDVTEADSYVNSTPKSGNQLDVDGFYEEALTLAYEGLVYGIQLALQKHDKVIFLSVSGNHSPITALAVRKIIKAFFRDEPRLEVIDNNMAIKYYNFGTSLFGFAHGDELKMQHAGEVMAADAGTIYDMDWFSKSRHRYFFFGHTHKSSVIDSRICKAESFRNLAPLNKWAFNNGYRRNKGTMTTIIFDKNNGETQRLTTIVK